jgi:hypothetical protein
MLKMTRSPNNSLPLKGLGNGRANVFLLNTLSIILKDLKLSKYFLIFNYFKWAAKESNP